MNKELKIGLLFIISIIALVFGVNYLKGINILNNNRNFHAVYEDIRGLQVGAPVMVKGYKVGMVTDITLLIDDSQNLLVTISIDEDFNISSNTVCKIVNQDLMGTKAISLMLGDSSNLLAIEDTLMSDVEGTLQSEVNAQILPLKNKAEELISSVDSLMIIITAILNKDTRESLKNSFQSLDKTFALMSSTMLKVDGLVNVNDKRISQIIQNLESITTNLETGNAEIKTILSNFSTLSDSFAKSNISATLKNINNVTSKINNGEGSIGLLLKDDKIYANFEKSTRELAELLEDIKNNPSRYVNFSIIGGGKSYVKPKSK